MSFKNNETLHRIERGSILYYRGIGVIPKPSAICRVISLQSFSGSPWFIFIRLSRSPPWQYSKIQKVSPRY